jgi:hypothetical protein
VHPLWPLTTISCSCVARACAGAASIKCVPNALFGGVSCEPEAFGLCFFVCLFLTATVLIGNLCLQKLELAGQGPPMDKMLMPNPRRFVLFPIQYPAVRPLVGRGSVS